MIIVCAFAFSLVTLLVVGLETCNLDCKNENFNAHVGIAVKTTWVVAVCTVNFSEMIRDGE